MKHVFAIILSLLVQWAYSQAHIDKKRIADKSLLYNRQAEERFALQVKTIDEFMERFNFSETTLLRQYMNIVRPDAKPNRQKMMKTLFEPRSTIADSLKKMFINAVCDSLNPAYLNFFQPHWYAQAQCLFSQGHQYKYITLILKVSRTPNGGSKWVIAGAEEFLAKNISPVRSGRGNSNAEKGLNPYSHVLNFTELDDALNDAQNLNSYLDENFITEKTKPMIDAISTKKINFLYVQDITYHFLQIEGWIFSVQEYKRMTRQSGWLISQLQPADQEEKDFYKQAVLYLTVNQ